MGPLMNANKRKCKTHAFVCAARSTGMESLYSSNDARALESNKNISVHLRLFADRSSVHYL